MDAFSRDGAGAPQGTGSILVRTQARGLRCFGQATSGGSINLAPGIAFSSALV
ncbi:hypothetical protein ABIB27_000008 [Arthrobacter sp. UYEF21]